MSGSCTAACAQELGRLRRRLERERTTRLKAEEIAERGLRDLYEKQQQLQLLEQIARAANQIGSVRDVFQSALIQICRFTSWTVGHAWLVKSTEESPRLHSMGIWHAVEPDRIVAFRDATEPAEFRAGVGLPGRVLETGTPAWLPNLGNDGAFQRMPAARQCGLRSACAFPVLAGRDVVAVLEFHAPRTLEPDRKLMRLMTQIGVELGRVIERQLAEDKLVHDASHDPLTGLPNRALFLDRLNQVLARSNRGQTRFAVLFIDLDRFKVVNDSLGHLTGDALIVAVAERLQSSLRETEMETGETTLARLGGDEFTVLLAGLRDPADAVRIADRLQDALRQSFSLAGQTLYATASIGIAAGAAHYAGADEVLRDADLAMYRAKALGKARSEVYDQTMHVSALNRLRVETDLRRALERGQFVLHYQPIVALDSRTITGFEALVRWQRPGHGLVDPGDFIPIAEDTGLIVPLGLWVLREACRTARLWQQEFPRDPPLSISINLSARQFVQPDLVDQVGRILREAGIEPGSVRLEVTESVTMGDPARAIVVLGELKRLGVRLSLDDFGTGYSSLSYLQHFPLDILKIDRSFVAALGQSGESLRIINAIMSLARDLGMEVVAEGAEQETEVAQLESLGCDFGQGYFFSKPVAAPAIRRLLRAAAQDDGGWIKTGSEVLREIRVGD